MVALYTVLLLLALAAAAFLLTALVTSIKYRRSYFSSIVELYLWLTTVRHSYETVNKRLDKAVRTQPRRYKLPSINTHGVSLDENEYLGQQVFVATPAGAVDGAAILYLYGGGYVRLPRVWHIRFITKLANATKLRIIFPIYPRAPHATADDTRTFALSLYSAITKRISKIILAGDSSGGGLTLLTANALEEQAREGICEAIAPSALILLSPFLDISLSDARTVEYEKKDPLIYISNTLAGAKSWAGGHDLTAYEVSPYFAKTPRHRNFYIFTGDRELLYPQICEFSARLKAEEIPHRLITRHGMNHVYQIYPIREAKQELVYITDIINGSLGSSDAAER